MKLTLLLASLIASSSYAMDLANMLKISPLSDSCVASGASLESRSTAKILWGRMAVNNVPMDRLNCVSDSSCTLQVPEQLVKTRIDNGELVSARVPLTRADARKFNLRGHIEDLGTYCVQAQLVSAVAMLNPVSGEYILMLSVEP